MFSLAKAKLAAVGLMIGAGVAMPVAAWYAHAPIHPMTARNALPSAGSMMVRGPQPEPEADVVFIDQAVIAAPRFHAPAVRQSESKPEMRCVWHQSETLANGAVRVCDIARTAKHRDGSLMSPRPGHTTLAPRDAPSPSGFIGRY